MLTKLMRLLARVPAWWPKRGRKRGGVWAGHLAVTLTIDTAPTENAIRELALALGDLPERNPDGTYGESEIETSMRDTVGDYHRQPVAIVWNGVQVLHGWTDEDDCNADEDE